MYKFLGGGKCTISQAITDEQKVKVAEYVKTCSGEASVTQADLAAAKTNPNLDTKDPKLQVCEHTHVEQENIEHARARAHAPYAIENI